MLSTLVSICCFAHMFFLSICMILSSWLSGSRVRSLHKPWIAIVTCVYIVDSFEDGVMLVLLTTVVTTGECSDPQFESEWNWATRSATHCAVSLASASWSQHSSIVWTKPAIPCVINTERELFITAGKKQGQLPGQVNFEATVEPLLTDTSLIQIPL